MIIILIVSGCQNHEKSRLIICFIDYSESAVNNRSYYQEQLRKISDSLKPGNRLITFRITDKTQTDAVPILDSGEYPKKLLNENPLEYKKRCEEFKTELLSKIKSACENIANDYVSKYTDILGVFLIASDIASGCKNYEVSLIILSDGLHDGILLGRRYNFEKDKIDDKYCLDLINTLEQNGLIPKLSGVFVYFIGVGSALADKSDERIINVRRFWERYIEQTGASLKGYGQTGFLVTNDFL